MSKPEYTHNRYTEITYNNWHRTLPDRCYATNLDWLEFRIKSGKLTPVAVIEEKDDRSNGIGKFQTDIMVQVAKSLGVPALVVYHNFNYAPKDQWKLTVKNLIKNIEMEMTANEWRLALEDL